MTTNVAVIYSASELREVAAAFVDGAVRMSAQVRLLRVPDPDGHELGAGDRTAALEDLEWADAIAFGILVADGQPPPALMSFIERTQPLWRSGRLFDKVVTTFTDEPEHSDPGSLVHPIFEALYDWGAVIVGPRAIELAYDAYPLAQDSVGGAQLPGPRRRTAEYRARRLIALADALVADRARRDRLEL